MSTISQPPLASGNDTIQPSTVPTSQVVSTLPLELATSTSISTQPSGSSSLFSMSKEFAGNIFRLFFKNDLRSGLRSLMALSAILIIIASVVLSPSIYGCDKQNGEDHNYNYGDGNQSHNPESALFGEDKYSRMFVYGLAFSISVALPSIIDIFMSFFLLRIQDHMDSSASMKLPREYTRICIIFTIVVPNALLLAQVIPPIVVDLVMFCQFIIISFAIVYRIFSLATTQKRDIPICELREIFLASLLTLILAFFYKLSLHNVIPQSGSLAWKHSYTIALLLLETMTVYKLKSWLRQTKKLAKIVGSANQSKELCGQKFTFYSLMLCVMISLGFTVTHIITYPLEYIYFPRNTDCYIAIEWLLCAFLLEWIAIRDYEVRKSEIATTDQLTYNRKMTRSISHEIRTPLNTAFMALELLISSLSTSSKNGESMQSPTATGPIAISDPSSEGNNLLEIAESIKEGCDIALNILNQLLTFEKLSAGMLQLENKLLTTENMLASNMKLFKMQAQQSGIEFKLDPGNVSLKHLYVYIDEHKMNQVLRNLLSNAMKFTPKGGLVQVKLQWIPTKDRDETIAALTQDSPRTVSSHLSIQSTKDGSGDHTELMDGAHPIPGSQRVDLESSVTVRVGNVLTNLLSASSSDKVKPVTLKSIAPHHNIITGANAHGTILISIVDSGPGVSREDQKKLFQEYVQINPGELQKGQGTGLGLSISKSIVQLHGGNIGLTSEGKGKGSTFYVELPAYRKNRVRRPRLRVQQTGQHTPSQQQFPHTGNNISSSPRSPPRVLHSSENSLKNDANTSQRASYHSRSRERPIPSDGNATSGVGGVTPSANESLYSFTTQQRGNVSEVDNYDEDNTYEGADNDRDIEGGVGGTADVNHQQEVNDATYFKDNPWVPDSWATSFNWMRQWWRGAAQISPYAVSKKPATSLNVNKKANDNNESFDKQRDDGNNTGLDNHERAPSAQTPVGSDALDVMELGGLVNGAEKEFTESKAATPTRQLPHSITPNGQSIKQVKHTGSTHNNIHMLQQSSTSESMSLGAMSVHSITSTVSGIGVNQSHSSSVPQLPLNHIHHHGKNAKRYNILVVDDSVPNRKMLSRLLTREHHNVTEAGDGTEAIEVVRNILCGNVKKGGGIGNHGNNAPPSLIHPNDIDGSGTQECSISPDASSFDLILMDYYMPNMNGPVAIEAIRRMGFKGMIVGVSGVMDDDVNHFVQAGANLVMCKPITLAALWKALRDTTFFDESPTVVELE